MTQLDLFDLPNVRDYEHPEVQACLRDSHGYWDWNTRQWRPVVRVADCLAWVDEAGDLRPFSFE